MKKTLIHTAIAGALTLGMVAVTWAADQKADITQFVSRTLGAEISIKETFEAPMGLIGVHAKTAQHKEFVAYVDRSLEHLVVGAIFDKKGNNTTSTYIARNTNILGEDGAVFNVLQNLPAIEDGNQEAPVMYVLADANCPYCGKLHEKLHQQISDNKVRVRWIIGSQMGHDGKAESIYYGEKQKTGEGNKLLHDYLSGASEDILKWDEESADKVAQVNRFMQEMTVPGTPYIIYQSRSGALEAFSGLPQDHQIKQMMIAMAKEGKQ